MDQTEVIMMSNEADYEKLIDQAFSHIDVTSQHPDMKYVLNMPSVNLSRFSKAFFQEDPKPTQKVPFYRGLKKYQQKHR